MVRVRNVFVCILAAHILMKLNKLNLTEWRGELVLIPPRHPRSQLHTLEAHPGGPDVASR